MTPQELAAKAADVIEERGLTKGTLVDGLGRVCTRGALFTALTGNPLRVPREYPLFVETERLIIDHIRRASPESSWHLMDIPNWNNYPARTQQEVVDTLRSAAGVPTDVHAPRKLPA